MWIEQAELDTKLAQAENKGWTKAIDSVRETVNARLIGVELGGDVDIMDSIDKLIQQSVSKAVINIKRQYDARTPKDPYQVWDGK